MRAVRRVRAAAAAGLALLGACAGGVRYPAMPAPETLPPESPLLSRTLPRADAWLRHYLMAGEPDSALALLRGRAGGRDELVRRLQEGVVLHQAGRWRESNDALALAEGEAERRYTQSLSQLAGTLVLNDAAVDYLPPPAERAMVPYYRMLNYLALDDAQSAAVEARKAGAYFTALRDAGSGEPCVGEALVQYVSGLAFARAGEAQDALVSFRQAQRAYDGCTGALPPPDLSGALARGALHAGAPQAADAEVSPLARDSAGEVVVIVEHGWVAHRAGADIHVPIFPEEMDSIARGNAEAIAAVVVHTALNLVEQAQWGEAWEEHPVQQAADALAGAHILRLAWPVYRLEACSAPAVRVVAGGDTVDAPVAGDLSAAVLRRWEDQRAAALARAAARAVTRFLASRGAERTAEKEGGEAAGWLAARVANFAGNRLERADTRSWSLLPDRVSVARLVLSAGEHEVRIEVAGPDGAYAQAVDLGRVTVRPGRTVVLSRRVWGEEMGDLAARHAAPRQASAR